MITGIVLAIELTALAVVTILGITLRQAVLDETAAGEDG